MRLSRSPELMPVTIDSSTCSGVAVDMRVSFQYTVVCYGRPRYLPRHDVSRLTTHNESRKYTEAQVRAEEACRADGRDAAADHRGGDRAARKRRAVPNDAQRGGRAG